MFSINSCCNSFYEGHELRGEGSKKDLCQSVGERKSHSCSGLSNSPLLVVSLSLVCVVVVVVAVVVVAFVVVALM